jgi:DegV family protein with EDD domain
MTDHRPVRIVTDSGADLSVCVADALKITVVPLVVLLGQEAIEEPRLTPDAFWALAERSHVAPGTSQPSLGAYYHVFSRLVQEGYDVVCITLTSRHSGTFSTACTAARPFGERVTVVDSHSLSVGMGYPVMEAARMALDGAPQEAIMARVASIRDRSRIIIHLESMEHVRMGGRAALLVPLVDRLARVISLKTALTIVDGELRLFGVARSTGKSLQHIAHEIGSMGSLEHIGVMHVRAPELAQRLVALVETLVPTARGQIAVGEAGPVLACHGGPGVVGIAAWSASTAGPARP